MEKDIEELKSIIESILFAAGRRVEIREIEIALGYNFSFIEDLPQI